MLDIRAIRENPDRFKAGWAAKDVDVNLKDLLSQDEQRRAFQVQVDELRAKKNAANDEISRYIKEKNDPKPVIASMKTLAAELDQLEPRLKSIEESLSSALLTLPNIPHESVPVGPADKNEVIREWGEEKKFDFTPRSHIELAENLDIVDFKRAAKISGSHFVLYKNEGACLERALINFMLDVHTREHGYTEIFPPFLVNRASMTGTGQLPKMAEDMYHLPEDDLYLIPTAEVPVTNIHRDEVIPVRDLPIAYTAYSACFRREAGSYGKDTRGMIRVHQFNKVELVRFVEPEASYDELETLVGHAETILQKLGLRYRVVTLASQDLSFASSKTYDLEVYAPGTGAWLEVSSCSNFEDFQARRAGIRFKAEDGRPSWVHTLNGSGLALARTMIAFLENYQTSDGRVSIPEVIQPYMGGRSELG